MSYYGHPVSHYFQDISCIVEPINNKGGIYLSNMEAALNAQLLQDYKIKSVITACQGVLLPHNNQILQFYMYVPAKDHQSFNLSFYFQDTSNFINKTLKHTNILVHCMAGISRSASLVIAYLIKFKRYTYHQALLLLRNKRKIVNPNKGFIKQLKMYETIYCQQKSNRMWSPKNKRKFQQYSPKNNKINFAWSQLSEKTDAKMQMETLTLSSNRNRQNLITSNYERKRPYINSPKKQLQSIFPFRKQNKMPDFLKNQLSTQQRKKRVEYLCKKYAPKKTYEKDTNTTPQNYRNFIQDNPQPEELMLNSKVYTSRTFLKKYEK